MQMSAVAWGEGYDLGKLLAATVREGGKELGDCPRVWVSSYLGKEDWGRLGLSEEAKWVIKKT